MESWASLKACMLCDATSCEYSPSLLHPSCLSQPPAFSMSGFAIPSHSATSCLCDILPRGQWYNGQMLGLHVVRCLYRHGMLCTCNCQIQSFIQLQYIVGTTPCFVNITVFVIKKIKYHNVIFFPSFAQPYQIFISIYRMGSAAQKAWKAKCEKNPFVWICIRSKMFFFSQLKSNF